MEEILTLENINLPLKVNYLTVKIIEKFKYPLQFLPAMALIQVFGTWDAATTALSHYLTSNDKTFQLFNERYDQKEREYRQQHPRPKITGSRTPINPDLIHLPAEEYAKIDFTGIGLGLEFHLLVGLYRGEGYYSFIGGISRFSNEHDGEDNQNIAQLVQDVQRTTQNVSTKYYAATITPIIYTFTEEISVDPHVAVVVAQKITKIIRTLPKAKQKKAERELSKMAPLVGLTPREQSRFERLYLTQR